MIRPLKQSEMMTIQERVMKTQRGRPLDIFEQLCGLQAGAVRKLYKADMTQKLSDEDFATVMAIARAEDMTVAEYTIDVMMPPIHKDIYREVPKANDPPKVETPAQEEAPKEEPVKDVPKEEPIKPEPLKISPVVHTAGESRLMFAKRLLGEGRSESEVANAVGYSSVMGMKIAIARGAKPTTGKTVEKKKPENTKEAIPVYEIESQASTDRMIVPIMYQGERHYYDLRKDPKVVLLYQISDDDNGDYTKNQLLRLIAELAELAGRMEEV